VPNLRFRDFIDLVLARMYENDQAKGTHNDFVSMDELARELKDPIPESWPYDALIELERQGLVNAMKVMGSNGFGIITGKGRLYVEEQERQGESIIHDYRTHPGNFVVVSGTGHQVAVGTSGAVTQTAIKDEARHQVLVLLGEVEQALEEDTSLDADERADALSDVAAARRQIEKSEPNPKAAVALLEPLSRIASVASAVASIVGLLA
jgi:hypothetical protein